MVGEKGRFKPLGLKQKVPWVRFPWFYLRTLKKRVFDPLCMVGEKGIEPPRIAAQDPKSSASTNFATRPKSAIQFSIHQAKLVF